MEKEGISNGSAMEIQQRFQNRNDKLKGMVKHASFKGVPESQSSSLGRGLIDKKKAMVKHASFRNPETQLSSQGDDKPNLMAKHASFKGVPEIQASSSDAAGSKQSNSRGDQEKMKIFRGFMEKQKSFRMVMERQLSFIDGGERKRNKESPGKRGDVQLHLAARAGNAGRVREILRKCDGNDSKEMLMTQNVEGETPLYAAAENGHANVVAVMLQYMDLQSTSIAARNGYDPFHIAAKQGHIEVLKELLRVFPNSAMTTDLTCTTALHTAANLGHIDIVNLLLETNSNLIQIARNNGKTVLHSAARMGHLEVVRSLFSKDPSTGFRVDRKGQTALHMAVKGQNEEIILELLKPDPSVIHVEDNKGNTALHIATKKGRIQNASRLLLIEAINVNAINKAGETPLDIAEKLKLTEFMSILRESGATNSKDLGKPQNPARQLKQTVSDIKHDVESQLQQTQQTGVRVQRIAKRLKKLHISGLNNAITSATVVAVLIATVAFAAIFTVPGQYVEDKTEGASLGQAHIAPNPAFLVFVVFDSLALFISLAVVVVQTSVVVIEQKAKKQLVFVINKLMWSACLFISIAFISLTYVVVGKEYRWLSIYATAVGGTIMLTTIGSMCYCVILNRMEESKFRNIRRNESAQSRSYSLSMVPSETEILNSEYKRMYAL